MNTMYEISWWIAYTPPFRFLSTKIRDGTLSFWNFLETIMDSFISIPRSPNVDDACGGCDQGCGSNDGDNKVLSGVWNSIHCMKTMKICESLRYT